MWKLGQAGREAKMFARFIGGLPGFLRGGAEIEQTRVAFQQRLRTRESAFVATLRQTVYEQPRSPYLALLRHANVELGDVAKLVEASLEVVRG